MQSERNYVISIAGFDPSAGAGILADIKTFEQLGVYGLGVCSAITIQHESLFKKVSWISSQQIIEQLDLLLEKYPVRYLKIGLIESFQTLEKILLHIKKNHAEINVVWDPVLSASAGFVFHSSFNGDQLLSICKNLFLITPNQDEMKKLLSEEDSLKAAGIMSKTTMVYLKSYQEEGRLGDLLLSEDGKIFIETTEILAERKHGSGCVLSSAITAFLASGENLKSACIAAKEYTHRFLMSAPGLLGEHHNIKIESVHA